MPARGDRLSAPGKTAAREGGEAGLKPKNIFDVPLVPKDRVLFFHRDALRQFYADWNS
jgi:hypothetical protein